MIMNYNAIKIDKGVNMEVKAPNRNGIVDIYRMIGSIVIFFFHSYHLDNVTIYPFCNGFVFVEMFFLLTGYFTVSHFEEVKKEAGKSKSLNAIIEACKYTIKKFSFFLPYTFITVITSLLIRHCIILKDFEYTMIVKALLESLMLIRGDSNVGVIWYLTTMLPIFPLFCLLCRKCNLRFVIIIAIFYNCIFHGFFRYFGSFAPRSYTRAMAGMFLGVITYGIANYIKRSNV